MFTTASFSFIFWLFLFLFELKSKNLEKDGNCGKFIGFNLATFCYKTFKKFALFKSISQLKATFFVYSEPIANGQISIKFSLCLKKYSKCKHTENREKDLRSTMIFHITFLDNITYLLNKTNGGQFRLK